MTNEEISSEITKLEEEFVMNNFVLNPQNKAIGARIKELQNMCTHLDYMNNFAYSGGRCIYCGRRLIDEHSET